jgi:hypothetical protein
LKREKENEHKRLLNPQMLINYVLPFFLSVPAKKFISLSKKSVFKAIEKGIGRKDQYNNTFFVA